MKEIYLGEIHKRENKEPEEIERSLKPIEIRREQRQRQQ